MKPNKIADLAARIDALDRECRTLTRIIDAMMSTPTTASAYTP